MNEHSFRVLGSAAPTHSEADEPTSPVHRFGADEPLTLDSGNSLGPWQIAYQTYGALNAERPNAVLVLPRADGRSSTSPTPFGGPARGAGGRR
jgi:homoserine O-acetyltransferase